MTSQRIFRPVVILVTVAMLGIIVLGCAAPQPAPAQPAAPASNPTTAPVAAAPTTAPAAAAASDGWDAKPIELKVLCASCLEPGSDKAQNTFKDGFMKLHPNVKVTFEGVPSGQFHQKVVTLGAAGNLPDVIEDQNVFVASNAEAGFILPLNDFADQAFFDQFLPGSIQMLSWKDKVYALQVGMVNTGMIYRKDLLDAAGLPEPPMNWTWEDFEKYTKALTKGEQYGLGIMGKADQNNFRNLLMFVMANGAKIVEPTAEGKWISKVNSPEGVEALAFVGKLINEDKVAPTNFRSNAFIENARDLALGRAAMFETGAHAFGIINTDYPDVTKNLRSRPFPGKQMVSRGFAAAWSVTKTGDAIKQRAAWEYIKYITNKENQILWNELTWWMPTLKAAYESPKLTSPQYEGFNEAAKHIIDYPNLPIQAKIEQYSMDAMQAVYTGSTDYKGLMDKMAASINAALEEQGLLGK